MALPLDVPMLVDADEVGRDTILTACYVWLGYFSTDYIVFRGNHRRGARQSISEYHVTNLPFHAVALSLSCNFLRVYSIRLRHFRKLDLI